MVLVPALMPFTHPLFGPIVATAVLLLAGGPLCGLCKAGER
jgi:hypothetical protein